MGKATAKLFASKGLTVIAAMRQPEKETELIQLPKAHLLKLDISNKKQISEAASEAEKISAIDIVFNNATYGLMCPLEGTTDDQLEQQIYINFLGPIPLQSHFFPI